MDLKITAKNVTIEPSGYREVTVNLDTIEKSDLDIKEVAECITPETFIEAFGEDALKDWIDRNLGWFEE